MQRLYILVGVVILLGVVVWFGPVRSMKIRHHCDLSATNWVDKNAPFDQKPAYYETIYNICVRAR